MEFIHKDSDKGAAVLTLANHLNIPIEEVMGLGDGGNDFQLIDTCGLGVAMGNAISSLKERADYVTATNHEDSVALAISKFALNKN